MRSICVMMSSAMRADSFVSSRCYRGGMIYFPFKDCSISHACRNTCRDSSTLIVDTSQGHFLRSRSTRNFTRFEPSSKPPESRARGQNTVSHRVAFVTRITSPANWSAHARIFGPRRWCCATMACSQELSKKIIMLRAEILGYLGFQFR
jgi:hypothetical protein